jgi:hypothetical protein
VPIAGADVRRGARSTKTSAVSRVEETSHRRKGFANNAGTKVVDHVLLITRALVQLALDLETVIRGSPGLRHTISLHEEMPVRYECRLKKGD